MQQQFEQQVKTGLGHVVKGLSIMADALMASGLGADPTPDHANPVAGGNATTRRAKKEADKKAPAATPTAPETAPAAQDEEQTTPPATQAAPAAAAPKKAAPKGKTQEPEFETLDREGRIEHLRARMVMVAQKLNGDRDKVYAFLKKYKAQKVNELTDENLVNLKNDIEVFLAGPDALDI